MRKNLALLVAAIFALSAASAGAQAWSNGQSGAATHAAKVHHRHAPKRKRGASAGWSASGASHQSGGADCPNGDCRGLNSPGNLGGAHEW